MARLVLAEAARKQKASPSTVLAEVLRRAAADRAQAARPNPKTRTLTLTRTRTVTVTLALALT